MTQYLDVNEAYWSVCNDLLAQRSEMTVRGEAMSAELCAVNFTIADATRQIITLPGRKLNYQLMLAEALWNLVPLPYDFMRKFNKRADVFVADQLKFEREYARWHYGHVLRHEIPRVVEELRKDAYTRRAVITLPQMHPCVTEGTPPCLVSQQFLYRKGELHCITTMRSNDVFLGLPLDLFQFMLFQHIVAAGAGMPVGRYTHQAGSLHLYERDLEAVQRVTACRQYQVGFPATLKVDPTVLRYLESGTLFEALLVIMEGGTARGVGTFGHLLDVLQGDAKLC